MELLGFYLTWLDALPIKLAGVVHTDKISFDVKYWDYLTSNCLVCILKINIYLPQNKACQWRMLPNWPILSSSVVSRILMKYNIGDAL